jgi:hypothetical protein
MGKFQILISDVWVPTQHLGANTFWVRTQHFGHQHNISVLTHHFGCQYNFGFTTDELYDKTSFWPVAGLSSGTHTSSQESDFEAQISQTKPLKSISNKTANIHCFI